MPNPYFKSNDKNFNLLNGDSMELLQQFEYKYDIFLPFLPIFFQIMEKIEYLSELNFKKLVGHLFLKFRLYKSLKIYCLSLNHTP